MSTFDLSQALHGSSESEEMGFESCCFSMTTGKHLHEEVTCASSSFCSDVQDVQDEVFRLDEGLDLVVSHDLKTMQHVAHLLLAVTRMKRSLGRRGRGLSDGELCSAIMDGLVDETIIKTDGSVSTGGTRRKFQRVSSESLCTLCDTSQKDVVHTSGEMNLQAVTLKGGHCERKVSFKLARYISACVSAGKGQTVALSITNTNLHISCSMKDGRAVLSLEECSEKDLQTISTDGNTDRFLFYRRTTGISLTTFESVRCRGWFISTSYQDENQPVEMCEADTAQRLTSFKLT